MKNLLLASLFLSLLSPVGAFAWGEKSWPGKLNPDPDVQVPNTSSMREACELLVTAFDFVSYVEKKIEPKIDREANRWASGEISEQEYDSITKSWQTSAFDADQRLMATAVGVLRQAGIKDWEMYSRWSLDGANDLLMKHLEKKKRDKTILSFRDKKHPAFKYSYRNFGGTAKHDLAPALCKRYE